MRDNIKISEASKSVSTSLWVKNIPPELENRITHWLFNNDIPTHEAPDLFTNDFLAIENKPVFYSELYKRMMQEQDKIAEHLKREYTTYFNNHQPEEAQLYHISPYRLAILLRKDLTPQEVFPNTSHLLRPVPTANIQEMIESGVHLY